MVCEHIMTAYKLYEFLNTKMLNFLVSKYLRETTKLILNKILAN